SSQLCYLLTVSLTHRLTALSLPGALPLSKVASDEGPPSPAGLFRFGRPPRHCALSLSPPARRQALQGRHLDQRGGHRAGGPDDADRKSTRLNSSHEKKSYDGFYLKKNQ